MNPPTTPPPHPLSSTTLLFRGELLNGTLFDGKPMAFRVWMMPMRHLLELVDLFSLGHEVALIKRCAQQIIPPGDNDGGTTYAAIDDAIVDNLSDKTHAELIELISRLNLQRAIEAAERQIASGQTMLPIVKRITATMIAPLKFEMASMMRSLTTASQPGAPEKQP